MGTIVTVANQKGGSGKTTSVLHLAAAYAAEGSRVLAIDLDPQGHLALGLGLEPAEERPALADILAHAPLTGMGPGLDQAVQAARPGIDIVPAGEGLAALDVRLAAVPGADERLSEHLTELQGGWDVVLLDTPPNLGLPTRNALLAAHVVLLPFQPSVFGTASVERCLGALERLAEQTGHDVAVRVLPTMTTRRDRFTAESLERLSEGRPGLVLPVRIGRTDLFRAAAASGLTVFEYSPGARCAAEYDEAARALAETWGGTTAGDPRRFAGLRVIEGGVEFGHPGFAPEEILIAGQFNDWVPDGGIELERRGPEQWTKRLHLPPGRYEYKFVVREQWIPDPANPRHSRSGIGVVNSVIDVPRTPPRARPGWRPAAHQRPD